MQRRAPKAPVRIGGEVLAQAFVSSEGEHGIILHSLDEIETAKVPALFQ